MKANIHPKYYASAKVICICGNQFTTGSTQETIHIELCNKCHPFYTGKQRFVDRSSLIQKFEAKKKHAEQFKARHKAKVEEEKRKDNAPKSLREMLMGLK